MTRTQKFRDIAIYSALVPGAILMLGLPDFEIFPLAFLRLPGLLLLLLCPGPVTVSCAGRKEMAQESEGRC